MQLGMDTRLIGFGLGGSEALAQLNDFCFPGTASADFGPAAGC